MKILAKSITSLLFSTILFISCQKDPSTPLKEDQIQHVAGRVMATSSVVPTSTPAALYLITAPHTSIALVKSGDVFSSVNYVALEASVDYYFNTKADGSGTSYYINEVLSAYGYADDDKVSWDNPLLEVTAGEGKFRVARSQAYKLTVDFSKAELNWQYYNIKLFYYTDWATRKDVLLNYKHPLMFEKLLPLPANHNMKFYSVNPDWLEWGSNNAESLSGTLSQGSGSDILAVKEAGSFLVSITLDNSLQVGTYAFTRESTLPITLISFTGKYVSKAVQLNWVTASEINVKGFEIERSEDGKSITTLPTFTNAGKYQYTLVDRGVLPNKVYYYRLKTIDLDGTIQLSKFIAINTKM
jgi:hypothetical protein